MRSESCRPFAGRGSARGVILTLAVLACPALAAERELEFPEAPERRRPLFPWFRKPLQKLPPCCAKTRPTGYAALL
jgi:hypothetical protein